MKMTMLLSTLSAIFASCALLAEGNAQKRCWSSATGVAARYWNQGDTFERGKYWYRCGWGGRIEPKGCLTPQKRRININERFVDNSYESSCILGSDNRLSFEYTACVPKPQMRYREGDVWMNDQRKHWFTCVRTGSKQLQMKLSGCVTTKDFRKIKVGDKVTTGEEIYECQRKWNGSVALCAIGCRIGGRDYKIGDSWMEGEFVYYCKLQSGAAKKVCIGCTWRNQRLQDGDRYQNGETVYQCEVTPNKFSHKPVGCVQRDAVTGTGIERKLGCTWEENAGVHKVEMTCIQPNKDERELPVKKVVTCIYRHQGRDTLTIGPNKYTIWGIPQSRVIACKEANARATIEEFDTKELAFKANGLSYTAPRGRK